MYRILYRSGCYTLKVTNCVLSEVQYFEDISDCILKYTLYNVHVAPNSMICNRAL